MSEIYLAGPMSGYENFNFPAFHAAANELRMRRYKVFNPAAKETLPGTNLPDMTKIPEAWGGLATNLLPSDVRYWDFQELLECDAIVLLPGWRESWGASLELAVALAIGLDVLEYVDEGGLRLLNIDVRELLTAKGGNPNG